MTTSVEEVARRNSNQPGLRLISFREVGLPYWTVHVRCRFLARKQLSALDEFVLRSVEADLRNSEQVASFLGIAPRVVDEIMANLVTLGHLVPRTAEQGIRYTISQSGRGVLSEMEQIVPEEHVVRLAYDGMTRTFTVIEREQQWRPRDLRDHAILEIPAFPADPPDISPSDSEEVSGAIEQLPRLGEMTFLSVVSLEGKREKFFMRVAALVFEAVDDSSDISVRFYIDGRSSPDHDLAFARAEGQRKVGLLSSVNSDRRAVEQVLGPGLVAQRAGDVEVLALRRATSNAIRKLDDARANPEGRAPGSNVGEVGDAIEEATADLERSESALASLPVRILEVHEHPDVLRESLQRAEKRLLIVSPWVRAAVVDDEFMENLKKLLQRGVEVSIAYGIGSDNAARSDDRTVERRLQELDSARTNFRFAKLGDTHAKVLIRDESLAVVTSFNWLSFRGDPDRPFRDERGTLVSVESEVERLYQSYLARIDPSVPAEQRT